MEQATGESLVGAVVEKEFVIPKTRNKRKLYTGRVDSYDHKTNLYKIVFEDDDWEEWDLEELRNGLRRSISNVVTPDASYESSSMEQTTSRITRSSKRNIVERSPVSSLRETSGTTTRKRLFAEEDSDASDASDMALDDDFKFEEDEGEDEDLDLNTMVEIVPSEDEADAVPDTCVKLFEEEGKPTVSPHKKKKTTSSTRSTKKSNQVKGGAKRGQNDFDTVANNGLPQGSRAMAPCGLEIRTLDSIPPLLTDQLVAKAQNMAKLGQSHDAARILHCGAGSVRSLIDAYLNPSRSQANLDERTKCRLASGSVGVDSDLPGRLMVVKAGESINCKLEGDVFESAKALHEFTSKRVATYSMKVLPDTSFGPAEVVLQRMETTGLNGGHAKPPIAVKIKWNHEDSLPIGSIETYQDNFLDNKSSETQWALIEGVAQGAPAIVLSVSSKLLSAAKSETYAKSKGESKEVTGNRMLPALSAEVETVRLPGSLLQKAIRRNFCSPTPILDSCYCLLMQGVEGGTLEMLKTTWRAMLEDASPFAAPRDGSMLGLEDLMFLSLIALADPSWTMPQVLRRKAVASAIRLQKQPSNIKNIDRIAYSGDWDLADDDSCGRRLRNIFLVMKASFGGKLIHHLTCPAAEPIQPHESLLMNVFEKRAVPLQREQRLRDVDVECRLAAFDSHIAPSSLLLLQASLPHPPSGWKKHSLPSIARQVNKLVATINARMPNMHQLARVAAWGKNPSSAPVIAEDENRMEIPFESAREAATSTGKLSVKEHEIIDCFEVVQRWRQKEDTAIMADQTKAMKTQQFIRVECQDQASEYDGRMAFLLAFAKGEEIEVHPSNGKPEIVNVLFCGDTEEPLLVQRIGKARKEASISHVHQAEGASGARAVPSLGYVDRKRSYNDRKLLEAAERAVSEMWKSGRTVSLPSPPQGCQWNLPLTGPYEADETSVTLSASLDPKVGWTFTIAGVAVEPFDARKVISPCVLDYQSDHNGSCPLSKDHEHHLAVALYCQENTTPEMLLQCLKGLHEIASNARHSENGVSEGVVHDWLPVAHQASKLTPAIWRDTILAIKTRENEDVALGPVLSDGTCRRDMTEGCLVRIFHSLESLYPSSLIKTGAFKWTVRTRGAAYSHMMISLDQLSRGTLLTCQELMSRIQSNKHKRSKLKMATDDSLLEMETDGLQESCDKEDLKGAHLPVPRVRTTLWDHQRASVSKVLEGIASGRRGHADASAVGAGKTLTALATIVKVQEYMDSIKEKRSGALVMVPSKALIKEWLLQIAEHTSGFHVVEQREDGRLHSLTYGKSTPPPPIDGNTIVISTLDRVREHPFTRQAAWDFVMLGCPECSC